MKRMILAAVVVVVAWPLVAVGQSTPTPPIIEATVTPAASCAATVGGTDPRVYTGEGHALIDIGRLDASVYVVHGVYDGEHFWSVTLTGRTAGNAEFPVLIEPSPFDEQTVLNLYTGDDYLMEVDAYGPWRVEIAHA